MNATILLTSDLSIFELACAIEVFALPRPEFDNWYNTKIVSLNDDVYKGLGDTKFSCNNVDLLPETELLIIPYYSTTKTQADGIIKNEVLRHYNNGGRIITFCSGSFLLAELGILDNRIATTHWRYASLFKKRFPNIQYRDDILYQYDGVIGCSAGSAAGIDLGIEVIRQDYGYNYANTVARRLVLPAHRSGGQSQFIEKPILKSKSSISQTLDWAVKNLSHELTIDDLARNANMTRRTFDRYFNKVYKITPLEWLSQRKLETAKTLLESTDLSIEKIAITSGYNNSITLRQNFKKYLSISPSRYRQSFNSRKHS